MKNTLICAHIFNERFIYLINTFIPSCPQCIIVPGFYYPMNYMEGVQVDFQKLTEWAIPTTVKDYEDAIARYIGSG